jgi:DNA-binding IclR family transcriptional regulator
VHDAGHATALGKSILGQLSDDVRADYLARHPLHDLTPHTVVDRRRLRLPAAGEVALDVGEYAVGVCCLAAAVTDGRGVGALGVVSGSSDVARRTVLTAAGRVSRALALGAGPASDIAAI